MENRPDARAESREGTRPLATSVQLLPQLRRLFVRWEALALLGAVLAVGFAAVTLWARGLGLSPDSSAYTSAALQLQFGRLELLSPWWPPGYPALLALGMVGLGDLHRAGWAINVLGLATLLGSTACLGWRRRWGTTAVIAALALSLLRPSLWYVLAWRWSELPFMAVASLGLLALGWSDEPSLKHRYLAATAFAGAALLRYSGYSFLVVIVATELVHHWPRSAKRHELKHLLGVCSVALLPSILWVLRNLWSWGTLHGQRPGSTVVDFPDYLRQWARILVADWGWGLVLLLLPSIAVLLWPRRATETTLASLRLGRFAVWSLLAVLATTVLAAVTQRVDPPGLRLSAPFSILLFPILGASLSRVSVLVGNRSSESWRARVTVLLWAVSALPTIDRTRLEIGKFTGEGSALVQASFAGFRNSALRRSLRAQVAAAHLETGDLVTVILNAGQGSYARIRRVRARGLWLDHADYLLREISHPTVTWERLHLAFEGALPPEHRDGFGLQFASNRRLTYRDLPDDSPSLFFELIDQTLREENASRILVTCFDEKPEPAGTESLMALLDSPSPPGFRITRMPNPTATLNSWLIERVESPTPD